MPIFYIIRKLLFTSLKQEGLVFHRYSIIKNSLFKNILDIIVDREHLSLLHASASLVKKHEECLHP